jgi:class 3 adenylate cyclase
MSIPVVFALFLAFFLAACAASYAWQQHKRLAQAQRRLDVATRELESLQNAFARFAPHAVVERIIADDLGSEAESRELTILFADLQGFTPMAEKLEPADLVVVLNGYFERMGHAIAANRGYLAKFIGDGLLALFGAPEPNPWHTNDAMHAALAMRAALADYNEELRAKGLPALAAGIGIHRGTVVTGVLGTSTIKEYGVLGRAVNLASRVESLTRRLDADILVTGEVRAHGDPRFELTEQPATEVKGIAEPVVTWSLERFGAQS